MASKHLTLRLPPETLAELDKRSRRVGRTRSELARTLLEEGLRMQAHPRIIFRDGPAGRRPGLVDGCDVWEIASVLRDYEGDLEQKKQFTMESMALRRDQVDVVWSYYVEYRDEIDEWIRLNDEESAIAEAAWRLANNLPPRPSPD
jgi:hypothetical protein